MKVTNGNQKQKIQNKTVKEFRFTSRIKYQGSGAFVLPDYEKIRVSAILVRQGKQTTIFNSTLAVLARESMYNANFESIINWGYALPLGNSVKLFVATIDLGTPINVKDSDELLFEVNVQEGWEDKNNTNFAIAGQSSMQVSFPDAIGVEEAIPMINVQIVAAGQGELTQPLGDNVTSVTVMNTDLIQDPDDNTAPVRSVILRSDKFDMHETLEELLHAKYSQFETFWAANSRAATFQFDFPTELDNVQLEIIYNSNNVASTSNYIVYRSMKIDAYTLNRGIEMKKKHGDRNFNKIIEKAG